MTGIQAFLDVLAAAGATHLFGNPGTTELPLQDALAADPRFRYFFGVHEVPVMAMADGYALASRRLAVVNLHIGCGLGNAMGMLYNAHVEGTPLLVTAGQQDRRLRFDEPVLAADLVRVARPWTKWAAEVQRAVDVPNAVRRAIQAALTPPTGPVFLSLPVDLQMEESTGLDDCAPMSPRPLGRLPKTSNAAQQRSSRPGTRHRRRQPGAGSEGAETLGRLADLLGAPSLAKRRRCTAGCLFVPIIRSIGAHSRSGRRTSRRR
ncbi:MAG: thiamine pyrophosphate-binding protein [Gemmataceae bacterium]